MTRSKGIRSRLQNQGVGASERTRHISERLRINSCRTALETQEEAAARRIRVEIEAANYIEKLEADIELMKSVASAQEKPKRYWRS